MKIDELSQQAAAAYVTTVRKEKQPETLDSHSDSSVKQQSGSDKVELSSYMPVDVSRKREEQETGLSSVSRVDQIKAQIASGSYNVSGKAVAEKMLANIARASAS